MFIPMKANKLHCALESLAPEQLDQASEMLRTLAHPARLRIVDLVNTAGELPVGEIMNYLDLAQSATSQHLNQMRRIGLLKSERHGKEVWYSIANPRPIALLNCICKSCDRNK
jgi:ArsR family transcriptional regulator